MWVCVGDAHKAAELVGLSDAERAGGEADPAVVARWLDDGIAPSGGCGRALGKGAVHGFDLTFCAPKSVSLIRALRGDDVAEKAVLAAHATAIAEALEYLSQHAGYTRVHNPVTGEKDLVRLPGLVAIAYQHETSRAGDPHLHTHVLVPNRQARGDGKLVSVDGTSLYHEAKAAGVIYQATLRRELHRSLGMEWAPVDPHTGMAELAGIDPKSIAAWSQRSSALREWAANHLRRRRRRRALGGQLAAAQKATRPTKPEQLAWAQLAAMWQADARGVRFDREAFQEARKARRAWGAAATAPFDRRRLLGAAEAMDKATFTRADLVELMGAQLPWMSSARLGRWSRPPSTRWECGSPRRGPRLNARAMNASPSGCSSTKSRPCWTLWTPKMCGRRSGSPTRTPRGCRPIRPARCVPLRARRGWCVHSVRRPGRARPPRCARWPARRAGSGVR